MPVIGFFLWFNVGISAYLRAHSAQDDGLPTYALVSGVALGATYGIAQVAITAIAFDGSSLTPNGLMFWWSLQSLATNVFVSAPATFFIFAVAHCMRRHGSGPAWLVWLGYVTALGQALCTFGVFSPSSFPAGSLPLFSLTFVLFVMWFICTAGYLALLPRKQTAASAPAG